MERKYFLKSLLVGALSAPALLAGGSLHLTNPYPAQVISLLHI